ncbi:MAG: glycosyltransferase family 2 protein, partial [Chloroflexota bacterium]
MPGTVYAGIVAYNSMDDLPACLSALEQQTHPHLHITILDNASADGAVDWLATNAPQVRCIASEENVGFGRGHNTIIKACNLQPDDYYMALNPDALLEPAYIAALVAALDEHGAGWGTGHLCLSADDGTRTDLTYSIGHGMLHNGNAFNIGSGLHYAHMPDEPYEVFGAPGAAAIYCGKMIRDILVDGDLFDPTLFLYYEDIDVDWRAQANGWRCISVPGAVAWHRGSSPHGELLMHAVANRYAVAVKNMPLPGLLCFIFPRMALNVLARTVIQGQQGRWLFKQLRRVVPGMWARRRLTRQMPLRH